MASTIEQQIAAEKKRLAALKKRAEEEAAKANASKESKASTEAIRKKIAEYESRLNYINTRVAPYIKKLAKGEKLTSTEKSIFDGLSSQFNSLKTQLTNIKFPGALPPVTTKKTGVTTKKPVVTTKKPVVTTQKPVFTTKGSLVTTKKPVVTTKKPVVTTKKPVVTTKKPVVTTKKPVITTPKTGVVTTKKPSEFETLIKKTEFWYDLPDYIFKTVPGLDKILVQAVDEDWDNEKFLAAARSTSWWQKNAPALRTRIIDREKYNELRAAGEDVTKTEYGLYLSKKKNEVKARARELAGVTLTEEQAQSVAEKIYNGFLDDDPLAINALIVPFIGKVSSIAGTGTGAQNVTAYSGQALQAYQTLQAIAKANGFSIKDILPGISTATTGGDLEQAVLQGLAAGTIDINRVAQDARVLASQGQPEYVRNLLNQGYDLENVYAPYKNQMAAVLEVDPNMIDLNDPTLRSAITDKGDMNLFDFKRQLRQDDRWQYTQSARDEVSSGALKVLQDFGFMG
jgi:hypothetical protein